MAMQNETLPTTKVSNDHKSAYTPDAFYDQPSNYHVVCYLWPRKEEETKDNKRRVYYHCSSGCCLWCDESF